GPRRLDRSGLHRQPAIGRQPLAPVLIAGLERLLDQQPAEAGAIDEQVALELFAGFEFERGDEAALAILTDPADPPLDAAPAEFCGEPAEEAGIGAGIEMIGVVDVALVGFGELARLGRLQFEAILAELAAEALIARLEPEMVEIAHPGRATDRAEGVEIAVAL